MYFCFFVSNFWLHPCGKIIVCVKIDLCGSVRVCAGLCAPAVTRLAFWYDCNWLTRVCGNCLLIPCLLFPFQRPALKMPCWSPPLTPPGNSGANRKWRKSYPLWVTPSFRLLQPPWEEATSLTLQGNLNFRLSRNLHRLHPAQQWVQLSRCKTLPCHPCWE